jgi:hypothetical protein
MSEDTEISEDTEMSEDTDQHGDTKERRCTEGTPGTPAFGRHNGSRDTAIASWISVAGWLAIAVSLDPCPREARSPVCHSSATR